MIQEIVNRLKTGTIKSVIKFGNNIPTPPYVVVKPETYEGNRGVRVIAHFAKGSDEMYIRGVVKTPMDDYVLTELVDLLSEYEFTDNHGLKQIVKDTNEITDISAVSDDNTVSMERLFVIPMLQY